MMAKRSARIQELREKSELSCMSGLFSILDSHQGCDSPKLISNGRPANKLIIGKHLEFLAEVFSIDLSMECGCSCHSFLVECRLDLLFMIICIEFILA